MQDHDKDAFFRGLSRVATAFNKTLNSGMIEVYWEELQGEPWDYVQKAFKRSITELKYFPKIAELLKFTGECHADFLDNNREQSTRGRAGPSELAAMRRLLAEAEKAFDGKGGFGAFWKSRKTFWERELYQAERMDKGESGQHGMDFNPDTRYDDEIPF